MDINCTAFSFVIVFLELSGTFRSLEFGTIPIDLDLAKFQILTKSRLYDHQQL